MIKGIPAAEAASSDSAVLRRRRHLGLAIRAARGALTQAELGRMIGVGQPAISAWESGRVTLTVDQLWAIEVALGLTHGWLCAGAGYLDGTLDPLLAQLEASIGLEKARSLRSAR